MRLVTQEKLLARLTLLFGLLALALAVKLFVVTAYTVAQRGPEIGIRMALGAERGDIVWMVLRGAILQGGGRNAHRCAGSSALCAIFTIAAI
jgi:macrolide transport system ATP-binding/permease protein